MTLENATQNIWKAHCNFYDPRKAMNIVIDKIFNDHETAIEILMKANEEEISRHFNELNAKDEEIERLKAQLSSVHNLMYRNGYNDAIDCYDTFGNFNTKHKPNAKARKIVAMLGKNWKKSRQFLGKNDEVTVSDQIAFIDAIAILKHKG